MQVAFFVSEIKMMKDLVLNQVTMTSREIADLTGKRHDNVMQVISSLITAQILTPEIQESIFKHRGNEYKQWVLNKRDSLVLVARLSPEFTAAVVDRWQELEQNLNLEQQRKADRKQARLEAPQMARALQEARARQGKESPSHVYSNDFDMINRIVLGLPAKKFKEAQGLEAESALRDSLSPMQIKAVLALQNLNQSFLELDMSFEERKEKLQLIFMRKYNTDLVNEVLKLHA
jgi:phage regulator Rha-like protein